MTEGAQRAGPPSLGDQLAAAVMAVPDFPAPGVTFRDITPVLADAHLFGETIAALAALCGAWDPEVVAGVESRGFVLGGAVAGVLGTGFVPVRKRGRLPRATEAVAYSLEYGEASLEIHTDALRPGARVAIVDDVLATGGTASATIALVERLHGVVAGLAFLLELADLGGAAALRGHHHTALLSL